MPRKRYHNRRPRQHNRQPRDLRTPVPPPARLWNRAPDPDEHAFTSIDLAAPGSTDWSSDSPLHWQNTSSRPALCLCLILTAAAIGLFILLFLLTSA